MEFPETLLTMAELSIGLVGVSGLVAVFLGKGDVQDKDKIRFFLILANGVVVALFAFTPIWVSRYFEDEIQIWQMTAAISLAIWLLLFFSSRFVFRSAQLETSQNPDLRLHPALTLLTVLSVTLLVLNMLNWPIEANITFHEIVMFNGLITMAFSFGGLVLDARDKGDT